MSHREDYEDRMGELLDIWRSRLDVVQARAHAQARMELHGPLHVWRAQGQAAVDKLAELRGAGDERWTRLMEEMEAAWRDLVSQPG